MGVSNVIDTLELNIIVNNKGTTARINNTTNALKKLHKVISDINGAGGVDGAVNGGGGGGSSSRGGSSRSSGSKSASSLMKNLNFGSMIAKLYFVRNITKQLGQDLAKVVQYGIDYEETLNLWQVAMKGNTAEARKFITEMNRAYGISEATLMNYQAIFKNMIGALGGIKPEVAYGLSELVTQMALDYSSLFNVGIEESMTKFQAAMSKQVRSIRNPAGYDVTQATLFEVYKDIGGKKTIRQLSELEKRLLIILAVYRQMKDTAVGDYAKTIQSTANQTRFMSQTIKEIATWIGVGANQWLKQSNLLIRINAYLLALRELAKSFATSMGYIEPTGEDNKSEEQKAIDDLLGSTEGAEENWENINDQVDEYKEKLLGFDKFQVLSSAGAGETGSEIDNILKELQKAKEEYQGILNQSQNIALFGDAEKKIKGAYDILKEWGFVLEDIKDEEENVIGQQWVKDGKTVKENIADIAKSLVGIITFIGLMTKPWLVLVAAIEQAYWKDEDFRNSVNKMLTQLGGAGLKVFQELAEIFIDIAPVLVEIVEGFAGIIGWLDEMELLDDVIWLVVDAIIAWKIAMGALKLLEFVEKIGKFEIATWRSYTAVGAFGIAFALAFEVFKSWDYMTGIEQVISVIGVLSVALLGAAIAFGAFHSAWSIGLAVAGIVAGIVAVTAAVNSAKERADSLKDMEDFEIPNIGLKAKGGLATKGSLFYAGEAGPELVTQTSGGGSTIMNMKQLEDAVARGFIRGFAATDNGYENDDTTEVYVDGQRLFNIMRNTAKRNGFDFVRV